MIMNTLQKREAVKAALAGDKESFARLTCAQKTYFKIRELYYEDGLKNPISQKDFEDRYRPGYDSLFELTSNNERKAFRYAKPSQPDFGRMRNSPEQTSKIITDLIEKLENE